MNAFSFPVSLSGCKINESLRYAFLISPWDEPLMKIQLIIKLFN